MIGYIQNHRKWGGRWGEEGAGGGGMGNWTEHTYSRKGDSIRQLHASSTKSSQGAVVMKPSIL